MRSEENQKYAHFATFFFEQIQRNEIFCRMYGLALMMSVSGHLSDINIDDGTNYFY